MAIADDLTLIQIEEPSTDLAQDAGLAIGFEITRNAIRVAVAVGGNAEILSGVQGEDYLAAVAPQDGGGADLPVGIDALQAAGRDARQSLALAAGLQSLLIAARRGITERAQRLVTGALAVVPPDLDRRTLALIMGAVEGADMALLGIIETPVAFAYADGLDRRPNGIYRIPLEGQSFWISVDDGVVRLEPESANATPLVLNTPLEHAVLGAALLAEVRNADQR